PNQAPTQTVRGRAPPRALISADSLPSLGSRGGSPSQALLFCHHFGGAALRRALALDLIQYLLPQAQVLGRRFHVFVRADVFQRPFERQLERRAELDAF